MGRLTQLIEYINAEVHPGSDEVKSKYTHINIDEDLKKVRKKYRKELNK